MKKFVLLTLLLMYCATTAVAQKLIMGEKAPDMKIKEWVGDKRPEQDGKARLVEFLQPSAKSSVQRLAKSEEYARKYAGRMNVVVVMKDTPENRQALGSVSGKAFYAGIDEAGRTFSNYEVRFIPYSVLIDARGRIQWFGSSVSLSDHLIEKYLP